MASTTAPVAVPAPPVAGAPSRWARPRAIVRSGLSWRSLGEFVYMLLSAPVAFVGFCIIVPGMALGVALAVTFVGLPLIAFDGVVARWIGSIHRGLAAALLGDPIAAPAPFVRGPGFLGWLQGALFDPASWRARTYIVLELPLAFASAYGAVVAWGTGLFWLTYPFWWAISKPVHHPAGRLPPTDAGALIGRAASHTAPQAHAITLFVGHVAFDTWPRALVVSLAGLAVVVAAPWGVRGLVGIDRWLQKALLGPSRSAARVEQLETARTQVVDQSAAQLRRIERDLHDGAQAQLVTLAMQLGQAREKLAGSPGAADTDAALRLVASAHDNAKQALVELRDLAVGIHPPALDVGLEAALATLAARSAIPASLAVELRARPTPAIEAIAYFSVAELVANAAEHSRASHLWVEARSHPGWLVVRVSDDGVGGAARGSVGGGSRGGTGLAGLDERVRAVDGRLTVDSPNGGPTRMTIELPIGRSEGTS